MVATVCENRPCGFFFVPLNSRCSRKWARPDLPGVSSAGADPVPHHVGDDRCPAVGDHDHVEPVAERETGYFGSPAGAVGAGSCNEGQRYGCGRKQGALHRLGQGRPLVEWVTVANRDMAIREYRRKSPPNTAQLRPYRPSSRPAGSCGVTGARSTAALRHRVDHPTVSGSPVAAR